MMSKKLTEQWKQGKLKKLQWYYTNKGIGYLSHYNRFNFVVISGSFLPNDEDIEVLDEVPDYVNFKNIHNKRCKEIIEENRKLKSALLSIQFETASLGGNEEDMEKSLSNIDWICDWTLRPEEMEEMSTLFSKEFETT